LAASNAKSGKGPAEKTTDDGQVTDEVGLVTSNEDGGSMARELRAIDRALEDFLSATCSLHGLQRTLASSLSNLPQWAGQIMSREVTRLV
jgi:hypothetical protein